MPTYDFKCVVCSATQELFFEIGEERLPVCCGVHMERVWTATPTIFKTGGFYKTGG